MTYEPFDVVIVPFPFAERNAKKRRPAVVISGSKEFSTRIGHSVLAMITSAKNRSWPLDVFLTDLASAGLPAESVVRMKLFTLDHQLIFRRVGALSEKDRIAVSGSMYQLFGHFGDHTKSKCQQPG